MSAPRLSLKRAYDPPAESDGVRVLVDRLWPRGLARTKAAIDEWNRDVAPTPGLRRWFGHDPARWREFRRRYRAELRDNPAVEGLRQLAREVPVTLVYAAGDEAHNNAVVLRDFLRAPPAA